MLYPMTTTTTDQKPADAAKPGVAFIAVTMTKQGSPVAVQFPTPSAIYAWEDAHPEIEVISVMPLVDTNYAEQVAL